MEISFFKRNFDDYEVICHKTGFILLYRDYYIHKSFFSWSWDGTTASIRKEKKCQILNFGMLVIK